MHDGLGLSGRLKASLERRAMTVSSLARELGTERSGLSTRLNAGRFSEEELIAIAEIVGRSPAYLRYGVPDDVEGQPRGFYRGMNEAARAMLQTVLLLQERISEALNDPTAPTPNQPRLTDAFSDADAAAVLDAVETADRLRVTPKKGRSA
jgi:transcriptional regulator with XRE-family HTH domain